MREYKTLGDDKFGGDTFGETETFGEDKFRDDTLGENETLGEDKFWEMILWEMMKHLEKMINLGYDKVGI